MNKTHLDKVPSNLTSSGGGEYTRKESQEGGIVFKNEWTPVINSPTKQEASHTSQVSQSKTPKFAEFLLCFFLVQSREERENLLGDLQEEYTWFLLRFGRMKARLWVYKQVCTSIWPLLRRKLLKLTVLAGFSEWVRRLIA